MILEWKITNQDGGDGDQIHSSTAELLVKVEDVQDKPPIFIGLPYVNYVYEDSSEVRKSYSAVK